VARPADGRQPRRRLERKAQLQWVPVSQIRVSPAAQRDLNPARVRALARHFDLEQFGTPVVSHRGGIYYVIDGQHRIAALRAAGPGDCEVLCWTYHGLTEAGEAAMFLKLNNTLTVGAHARFKVALRAGLPRETTIDWIVRGTGLRINPKPGPGAITCVDALVRVYQRSGPGVLDRALRIVWAAYGDAGLKAPLIDGISRVCHRYNDQLDDMLAVTVLGAVADGAAGLLHSAAAMSRQTRNPFVQSVAAMTVVLVNREIPGKKLRPWWTRQ
jgi:hypothetical protein